MTLEDAFTGGQAAFIDPLRVAYLGTVYADGRPHVVPISPVLDMNRLAFATERDTQKVRNLQGDPHVSIGFDEYTEDWSQLKQVIVHGVAYFIESGPEFHRYRAMLYEKYEPYETEAPIQEGSAVIVAVRVDRVVSWGV